MLNSTPSLRDIRLGTDLDELVSLRPDRTMTTWDPEFFSGGDQFWLHGQAGGASIFVIAARLFQIENLKSELESLRIFYYQRVSPVETCQVECLALQSLGGHIVCTGNLFVFPAFRGRGLPAIATRALHREILSRWDVDWIFGLQEKELAYKGLWQDQLYSHCEGEVIWSGNPYGREFRMKIVYSSREEMEQAIATS